MKTGALAMMDALGLRGRWRREDPNLLLAKLQFLKADAEAYHAAQIARRTGEGNEIDQVTLQFLSDTIVLGVTVGGRASRGSAVVFAAAYVSRIMQLALETKVPFAYRGSVAFGEFETADNFIVGSAVDDAAAHAERAEGAFVWLLPSATDALRVEPAYFNDQSPRLIRHQVPLKGGQTIGAHVATPLFGHTTGASPEELSQRLLSSFEGPLDVHIKRQNTEPFVREALARVERTRQHHTPSAWTVAAIPVPNNLRY